MPSPQPQAASVPESDPVLAVQKLVAAEFALAQSVNAALPTAAASQGGLAPLLADLVQAQQTVELPPPLQAAIIQVLALRSPLDAEVTGTDIKAALAKSGLFSEANAAADLRTTNAAAPVPPAVATDIKTALLVLRQVLQTWLSDAPAQPEATPTVKDAAPEPARPPANNPQPPPYGGRAASAQPPMVSAPTPTMLLPPSPEVAAKTAPAGAMPPPAQMQAATIVTSEAMTDAPQKYAIAEGAPVVPRPATPSGGQVRPAPAAEVKANPPVALQGAKLPSATLAAKPDAPPAKLAVPEPLRAPPSNPPPPTYRAPTSVQPPVPPMYQTPVASTVDLQTVPKPAPTGPSQPQAQSAPATEATPEEPQAATAAPAAGMAQSAPSSAAPLPAGADLKASLIVIQQLLKATFSGAPTQPYAFGPGKDAVLEPPRAPAGYSTPPPYRGGPTSAQPPLPSTLPADANPRLVGEVLLNHTEAALAHLKLLQIASLPDSPQGTPQHADQGPRWMFEMPFSTPQGSAIAQFEIRRDGRGGGAEQTGPVWRARFSLDVEPIGPVHAQIVLMGGRAWVTLWAEREASVQTLRKNEAQLNQALKDSDVIAEVAFCLGTPHRRIAAAGQFLDRAS